MGRMAGIKRLVINLDNGPECSGHRRQFLQRMVAFADREELEVRLIYYPPYHSKYNGIERYRGGLERSWNGYLLDSVTAVLLRASQFVWRSARTTSTRLKGVYQKGVKLCGKEKQELEKRLSRSEDLVFDPRLVGTWAEKGVEHEPATWSFEKAGDNAYKLAITEKPGKEGEFTAHLFKLKQEYFLDLLPKECNYATNQADLVEFSNLAEGELFEKPGEMVRLAKPAER